MHYMGAYLGLGACPGYYNIYNRHTHKLIIIKDYQNLSVSPLSYTV